jgi:hypothetical protein
MSDYYKQYIKENPKISKTLYNNIISDFNEGIRDLIINEGLTYQFPYTNFQLFIKKHKRRPRIVNGKLINSIPINWKATKELWEKDEEAKEKKILIRFTNYHTFGYVFRILFKKFYSNVKNKSLYKFKNNRKLQRELSKRILDNTKDPYDAFLIK